MAFVTLLSLGAVAERGERTADGGSRGNVDVGVAACTVCAVAAQEVGAGRHAVVIKLVGHVAAFTTGAGSGVEEFLADSNFLVIVREFAGGAEFTGTWIMY